MPNEEPPARKVTPALDPNDPDTARFLEGLDLRDALIAGLAAAANDIAEMARDLFTAARLTRLERGIALGLLALNLLIGIGVAVMVAQVFSIAHANRQTNVATQATLDAIKDCTTQGGECHKQGEAQTQGAVADVGLLIVVTVECDRFTVGKPDAVFEACVRTRTAALSSRKG